MNISKISRTLLKRINLLFLLSGVCPPGPPLRTFVSLCGPSPLSRGARTVVVRVSLEQMRSRTRAEKVKHGVGKKGVKKRARITGIIPKVHSLRPLILQILRRDLKTPIKK